MWRARWGRTGRAVSTYFPEQSIRYEVGNIFEHQDILERGLFALEYDASRRADDARAGRELFGDTDSE